MTTSIPLSRADLWLFRLSTAFSVAAVVYHQSMTQMIAANFHVPAASLSILSVATQLGYGIGLVLGLPLGDTLRAKRLIPLTVGGLGIVLLALSAAPSLTVQTGLCALAGMLSIGGQLLIAYCARTALPEQRAGIIGSLLSALFAGLLFARVLSGWGAEYIGWRAIYLIAGGLTLLCGLRLLYVIADVPTHAHQRYGVLLKQQAGLWSSQPELRRLALVAACFFAASNGIWANVVSLAHTSLNWSAGQTGLLAFTSVVALRAPASAQWLQRYLPWTRVIVMFGAMLAAVSLAGFAIGTPLWMIVAFFIASDFSIRSVHAIAQGRVLGINPAAASRMNSLFMTVFFIGAALGSWLGGIAARNYGWSGMYLFPMFCAAAGVLLLLLGKRELKVSAV